MQDDWDEASAQGFVGFKLNPLVNRVSFLAPGVKELCEYLVSRDLPLYTHIVLHGDASLDALELLLKDFRKLKLILGRMGFAYTDLSAIHLASRLENVYLATSVRHFIAHKEAVRRVHAGSISLGTTLPMS